VIFSDNAESNACRIGKDYDVPVVTRDIRAFYSKRGRPRRDMAVREDYDRGTLEALAPFHVRVAAFAGYMSVASRVLVRELLSINVHPADLSIREGGRRKFKGDHAVADAIRSGEKTIASTTHIVEDEVDEGRILMISPALDVEIAAGLSLERDLPRIASDNQERLKQQGDWVIFPSTLQLIAEGRFEVDETGLLHFGGKPAPDGIRYGTFI
jgi:folate-dependent phosphoribosylglycinamide formyltransferase PurN